MPRNLVPVIVMALLATACSAATPVAPVAHTEDTTNAQNNYVSQRSAQMLDSECSIMTPLQRATVDQYVVGLRKFIAAKSPEVSVPGLELRAQTAMASISCDSARRVVGQTYIIDAGRKLMMEREPFAWAMDLGARCKVITSDENSLLFRAWNKIGQNFANEYGRGVFAIGVMLERGADRRADTFPCSSARQLINTTMRQAGDLGIE